MRRARRGKGLLRHPSQIVAVGFAAAILLGTLLLMLPVARTEPGHAPFLTALFTATSAVCVTGLVVVDTPTYWSTFGEITILGLIQVGGIGIMTLASMLALVVFRRLGLRFRLTAAVEHASSGLGDVRSVILGVVGISLVTELIIAIPLTLRFWLGYGSTLERAVYDGVFHSVSAFNNAGFALRSDNLMGFVDDPWICLPIAVAVIAGGLGFPVWLELLQRTKVRMWSLHTKMTVSGTVGLLLIGTLFFTAVEWSNPDTLGALNTPGKLLAGFFQSTMTRTAGFNSLDYEQMHEGTLLGADVLMIIGGGSAGTAGGLKITTFMLLFFVIVAEVRGQREVEAFDRRIDPRAIRQALTVALLSVGFVVSGTIALLHLVDAPTHRVLFEAVSAFATVGLSANLTYDVPAGGQIVLIAMMFVGRIGPITLVSALALRDRERLHRFPEGRPLIG
ncbi:TrkH family potassium uptake protein [Nocardioides sp. KC13]|uniref:TrkH family potassium uptake protein n=2 Tax=Nocardioides turkmenicus TaxID=2711220 RepID=A0A6M1R2P0_9ACTN|nr:potassium transporter TrkG [Nocardioides sp. KC13]NGN94180.1 TrkH family potassium uptake protein [Nocardioides sp. KC13]